jgi:hypothetical protein
MMEQIIELTADLLIMMMDIMERICRNSWKVKDLYSTKVELNPDPLDRSTVS